MRRRAIVAALSALAAANISARNAEARPICANTSFCESFCPADTGMYCQAQNPPYCETVNSSCDFQFACGFDGEIQLNYRIDCEEVNK
jgi:hypothetical protein